MKGMRWTPCRIETITTSRIHKCFGQLFILNASRRLVTDSMGTPITTFPSLSDTVIISQAHFHVHMHTTNTFVSPSFMKEGKRAYLIVCVCRHRGGEGDQAE